MNHGSNRAERYIRTLNDIICKNLTGISDKWPLFVLPSCWAMNTQVSKVTGFSPFEMVYHTELPDLFNFNYKPGKNWNKCKNRSVHGDNVQEKSNDGPNNHRQEKPMKRILNGLEK